MSAGTRQKEKSMTMTIEVGKYYRTRNHCQVRILATDRVSPTRPIVGLVSNSNKEKERVFLWSESGHCHSDQVENALDIVREWYAPPVVDWPAMPAWARYVAQNEAGSWWWFSEKPKMVLDRTIYSDEEGIIEHGGRIPAKYTPAYSGPWEDSLVERPAESEAEAD